MSFVSTPTPTFPERHGNVYENFLPHSVSTTCNLTPLPSSLLLTLVIVQVESALNSVHSHTAELTVFIITF